MKTPHRFAAWVLAAAALPMTAALSVPPNKVEPGRKLDLQNGKEVYESSCARCHDSGVDGAPKLRDGKDWEQRAVQWFSVLKTHAGKGFLKMPAKGQKPILTDDDVSDAVFYMLQERKP